ncbi:MAG: hypothetical protein JNL70_10205 [Saprospiraceae bacterium]|nr:hypothetical protein [Saprospiraceae bacterium]
MKIKGLLIVAAVTVLVLTNSCDRIRKVTGNHSASPFDTTKFETQALSDNDRALLANANGKTVKPVSVDALAQNINTATEKLHVFCFWNLKNEASTATVKALNELSAKFDSTKLKIVYVNMPGYQKVEDVNLFIRENQLTDETLILEKADVSFFAKKIRKDFVGITHMPVILMVNKAEETMMFFNKGMDEKELLAVVNPLVVQ